MRRGAAERALDDGAPTGSDRLDAVLRSATAPGSEQELRATDRAVSDFRSHATPGRRAAPAARSQTVRWFQRFGAKGVAIGLLTVGAVGGVAVAADTGVVQVVHDEHGTHLQFGHHDHTTTRPFRTPLPTSGHAGSGPQEVAPRGSAAETASVEAETATAEADDPARGEWSRTRRQDDPRDEHDERGEGRERGRDRGEHGDGHRDGSRDTRRDDRDRDRDRGDRDRRGNDRSQDPRDDRRDDPRDHRSKDDRGQRPTKNVDPPGTPSR